MSSSIWVAGRLLRCLVAGTIGLTAFAIAIAAPASATPEAVLLDFDALPLGTFQQHQEDGFGLNFVGFGDPPMIADVSGNHVLKDSALNVYGAGVNIRPLNGTTFYFNSLEYADLNATGGRYELEVRASPYPFDWSTSRYVYLHPTSSSFSTLTSTALGVDGIELAELGLNFVSSVADYAVDNISLSPSNVTTVQIKPESLNLDSNGLFTALISFDGYDVSDADITTVTCEGASAVHGEIDGTTLVAKFRRQDLVGVSMGEAVQFTVSGTLYDGRPFAGTDTVRVIGGD